MNTKFEMVAKTFQGLEDVLRDELIALGAENVEIGRRMVSFEGDNILMYRANLCCRTALRILKPIVKFTASDTDELYDCIRDTEWDRYMSPDSTFAIDATVNSADFNHSRFATYRVKDGIADYFNDKYGRRPSIRLAGADVILNVHISDNRVTISLDSSGEPLSKRGYRVEQTAAPINEVLAAGIILKTGWRGDCSFVDPMCGSGTFLIEAAMIAANINPGIYRRAFAFEKWPDFDPDAFAEIYNDDSQEREVAVTICGGDIDPEVIAIARKNIREARLDNVISIECKPFQQWRDVPEAGILITNPPYGERLRPDDICNLFREVGTELKMHFKGYHAWILGYKEEHFACIGLRPSVKFPILNGALECSLREYVLFDGSMQDFKKDGGTTRNETFNRETRPKMRHISDGEWKGESRKFNRDSKRREFRQRDDNDDDRRRGFRKDDKRGDRRREYRQHGHDDSHNTRRNRSKAIVVKQKGPRLSADATVFTAAESVRMRSRKPKKFTED